MSCRSSPPDTISGMGLVCVCVCVFMSGGGSVSGSVCKGVVRGGCVRDRCAALMTNNIREGDAESPDAVLVSNQLQ